MAPKTQRNANNTAPHHTSPSRLQNECPHAEQRAKNPWQPKCGQSACSRSSDDAAPRSTVRGKPAYATGATPDPAPAFVRRRPRQTSRRAKRTSPQRRGSADDGQDPRRRRAECSVATAPRNGVAQPAPRSRARAKAAAYVQSVASMAWRPPPVRFKMSRVDGVLVG